MLNRSSYHLRLDKMKYKNDKLPYALCLLGLVANVFYFVVMYGINESKMYTTWIGASIIYNLLFMLFTFLCSEEIKTYSRKFWIVAIVLGALQFGRIFILPAMTHEMYILPVLTGEVVLIEGEEMTFTQWQYARSIIYLCVSGCLLIASGIISLIHSTKLANYIAAEKINDSATVAPQSV